MYFDTHAHYNDERYGEDCFSLLERLNGECGVDCIVNVSWDIHSSHQTDFLAKKYPFVYGAVGVHPNDTKDMKSGDYDILRELASHEKIVAIGETGLDYHYEDTLKKIQKKEFDRHLSLAEELDMPVVIHEREATKDVLDIISLHSARGVFHCFSGSVETAKIVLSKGYYIALGGVVTFKNAKTARQVAKYVPEDRLLIETDAPYLTPEPFRGKRNSSEYLSYICEGIAKERGTTAAHIAEITKKNAEKLFMREK